MIGLFSQNAETIAAGSAALRTISLGFVISSVSVIACGALEGLGMGVPSLVISLLRYTLFIIPAAFLLSRLWGAQGVLACFLDHGGRSGRDLLCAVQEKRCRHIFESCRPPVRRARERES